MNKKNRLTKRGSFTYVYKKGKPSFAAKVTLIFVPHPIALKIGFSVNNKIGKAVTRNLIKRRLRAIISGVVQVLKPCQMVVSVKPGVDELSFLELKKEVLRLIERSGLFIPSAR